MKKTALVAFAALMLSAGAASAAPKKFHHEYDKHGKGLTRYERLLVQRSAANVSRIKFLARIDGRVTRFERFKIRNAEIRHAALVARLLRS